MTPRLAGWFLIVFNNHSGSQQSEKNQRAHTLKYYYSRLPSSDCLSFSFSASGPAKTSFLCGHPASRPFQEVRQHILLFPTHHSLERAFLLPCRSTLFSLLCFSTYRNIQNIPYIYYTFSFFRPTFFLISLFFKFHD